MSTTLTPKIALEIASHEAIIRQAYKDSVGVWTWSVGLTNASGHNVERYIDNPQPMRRCLEVYIWALNNYADAVRAEFSGHDLTEAEFGGALSFHWNTGAIRSASWPDLWKAGKVADARNHPSSGFMAWKKPASIVPRREKEAALFFDGVWSGDGSVTEFTRLTRNYSPNWSSGERRDVSAIVNELLGAKPEVEDDMMELKEKARRYDVIAEIVRSAA